MKKEISESDQFIKFSSKEMLFLWRKKKITKIQKELRTVFYLFLVVFSPFKCIFSSSFDVQVSYKQAETAGFPTQTFSGVGFPNLNAEKTLSVHKKRARHIIGYLAWLGTHMVENLAKNQQGKAFKSFFVSALLSF